MDVATIADAFADGELINDLAITAEQASDIFLQLKVTNELLAVIMIMLFVIFAFMVFVFSGKFIYDKVFKNFI